MLRPSDVSKKAVEDFHLAAAVKMAMTREGHGRRNDFYRDIAAKDEG